ncbi:MAG: glycosyltransferase [Ignavibacteriae bacterium]|nr:glycosyltransferase [Ignavibacteriota bacterium]MCB9217034.1 glycosyltransferase [Ignavibacteria bacterium]
MKILGITSRIPWPLTDGARICMYHALSGLAARGHELHIVAPEEGSGPFDIGALDSKVKLNVYPFNPGNRIVGAARTIFHERPYTQLRKEIPGLYTLLDRLGREEQFDAMYVDQSHVAAYGTYMKEKFNLPYLFRSHNVEHEIWRRHTDRSTNPLMRLWLESQCRKWKEFEVEAMRSADVCAAITERDANTIKALLPELPVETIPASVDLERFSFVGDDEREEESMILLGGMKWAPNRDAAIWFANDILPLILREVPTAVCYLVGEAPPLSELPPPSNSFKVEGYVDEILPYYRSVAVGVIPLRVGGGMRVKMVEMMASGLPIVSSSIGAEGNLAEPGEHYLKGDSAEEIAGHVVRLLKEKSERKTFAEKGRAFVEQTYSVEEIGRQFEELLEMAIHRRRVASELTA